MNYLIKLIAFSLLSINYGIIFSLFLIMFLFDLISNNLTLFLVNRFSYYFKGDYEDIETIKLKSIKEVFDDI